MTDEQIIEELGIGDLAPEIQEKLLDEYSYQIGALMEQSLSQEKLDEYLAIINGDQAVIDAWLQHNAPDYRTTEAYNELAKGYDEDPEKVPADKAYAALAWVRQNAPSDFEQSVNQIKERFKADIAQYSA